MTCVALVISFRLNIDGLRNLQIVGSVPAAHHQVMETVRNMILSGAVAMVLLLLLGPTPGTQNTPAPPVSVNINFSTIRLPDGFMDNILQTQK